jgi:phosphoglycerol transferase MdoB-like AlkP superfamily enzyme
MLNKLKKDFLYLLPLFGLHLLVTTYFKFEENNFRFSSDVRTHFLQTAIISIVLAIALSVLFYFMDMIIQKISRKVRKSDKHNDALTEQGL